MNEHFLCFFGGTPCIYLNFQKLARKEILNSIEVDHLIGVDWTVLPLLPVDVVEAVVVVAPGGSPVQGEGQLLLSVHGTRQEVFVVDGGVLY